MTAAARILPQDASGIRRIADRINALSMDDLQGMGAWDGLSDLSSNTTFEGIDTNLDSVVIREDGSFEAIADVYVSLNYGEHDGDPVSLGDAYPATVRGRISAESVSLDSTEIDTGSFYE
jgi:hypothetical protein